MRDQDSITSRVARVSTVTLRRLNNGFQTVAQMVDSLPELSRIREANIALPSSLWAFHHDPSRVVVLTPPDPHPLSTPTLATHPRCECRHRFNGSRGLPLPWRRVFTPVYGPPSETVLASDTGVSCLQHDPHHFCSRRGQVGTGKLCMAPSPLHLGQGLRRGLADGFRFG